MQYSEAQIQEMIYQGRRVTGILEAHAREYSAYLEGALSRFRTLKSQLHKDKAWKDVQRYAYRLEKDLPTDWAAGLPKT